ncbi:MAG TPA: hypothetical protein VGA96_00080, partial [Fibrella sp.]
MKPLFTFRRLILHWLIFSFSVLQALPGLSQGYVDDGKRYAMYTLYHYGDIDGSMQRRQIRGMEEAFSYGCNSVVIGISWDVLQPTMNSAPNWAYIDRFIEVAQKHNAKIAIRMKTVRSDLTGYWPQEQSMVDSRGNPLQAEGSTHARFGYAPAMDKVQEFVRS